MASDLAKVDSAQSAHVKTGDDNDGTTFSVHSGITWSSEDEARVVRKVDMRYDS
jgi:hypothetical protein